MDMQPWIGKPLVKIGRVTDMLWIGIGKDVTITFPHADKKREVSELAVHFQCPWRLVQAGSILVASHDIYDPYDPQLLEDECWDWDVFGRDKAQSSRFDVAAASFNQNMLPLTVTNICMRDTGDLHIEFDKNVRLDTFITNSRKQEFYRLIDFNSREHFVVFEDA